MKTITSKKEVQVLVQEAAGDYSQGKEIVLVEKIHQNILKKKIKFPLLESAAKELYQLIPVNSQLKVTDHIISLHELGGNVLAGIILQLRLQNFHQESHKKAIEYIIEGNQWYVCDIIGERVMGYALLTQSEKTIPVLKQMANHPDKWIVRAVGVATHYAVKKGLKKEYVGKMFELLLSLSGTTDFHTKKGVGWAAKTISKFHPDIIEKYSSRLQNDTEIKQWFKTKIKIGLGRTHKYANRYTS